MIAQFSLRLICGMSMMWGLMPRNHVTSGFFRIQMLVTLGLSVLSALTLGELSGDSGDSEPILSRGLSIGLCVLIAVCSFLGSVMWMLERRRAGTVFVFVVLLLSTIALLFSATPAEQLQTTTGILRIFSDLSAASILGGATTGMLLGHWYLTTPTMSIAPLSRLTLLFGIAGVGRLVISGIGLLFIRDMMTEDIYWMWLTLRWAAGVVGPLIIAFMVWRILKYRNTQSATGVLFVGVIICFIGEMTALLLFEELGIAL
jgi:hypothetical protein